MKLFCAKMFCFCCLVFTYFGFVSWFLLVLCFLCRKNFFLKNKQTQIILIISFTILLMYTLTWTFLYLCECSWSYVWVFSFLRESFFLSMFVCENLFLFMIICQTLFSSMCMYSYLYAVIFIPHFSMRTFLNIFLHLKSLWK